MGVNLTFNVDIHKEEVRFVEKSTVVNYFILYEWSRQGWYTVMGVTERTC